MKVGDLVRPLEEYMTSGDRVECVGLVVDWHGDKPIVFWCNEYPQEIEFEHQLEGLSEKIS
tara:strand:- start:488 stop:670 length:183 start_codon:yes stop_codon:yes gene_type:complete